MDKKIRHTPNKERGLVLVYTQYSIKVNSYAAGFFGVGGVGRYGTSASPCSRHSPVADCCAQGDELFGSIKVEKFPELMSNYCLLCKDLFHESSVPGTQQAGQ